MQIHLIDIDRVQFDKRNARKHNDRNIEAIKKSLQHFGQQKPIVIDASYNCVAGNGTLQAAKNLGWSQISVVVSQLSQDQLLAYALADNRTAELAEWDPDILASVLQDLAQLETLPIEDLFFDSNHFATVNNDAITPENMEPTEEPIRYLQIPIDAADHAEANKIVCVLKKAKIDIGKIVLENLRKVQLGS